MPTSILHSERGTKAVVISSNTNEGPFTANLYVNCNPEKRDCAGLGDITLLRKVAKRFTTIKAWSIKQLADL